MVKEITQEIIYKPIENDLQAVTTEILSITDKTFENSSEQDNGLETQLRHILTTPGKRIRPAVTLLASRLWGHFSKLQIRLAASVELLHIATLVHDDTVDHADTRRGHHTASKLWGRNMAVILGDFLFASSARYVCDTNNFRIVKRFTETATELARGEHNEIYTSWQTDITLEAYKQRIYNKTASLFCTAAESGAILGEGDEKSAKHVRNYGYNIGMAYQVYDDLLDYKATSKQLGKPSGNDLNSGIITLPAIIASENGAKDEIFKFFNSTEEAKSDLLPITIEAIIQTGALEKTNEVANNYIKAAVKSLDDIPSSEYRDSMMSLAEYVPKRKY